MAWKDKDRAIAKQHAFRRFHWLYHHPFLGGIPIYPTHIYIYLSLLYHFTSYAHMFVVQGKSGKQPKMSFVFSASEMVIFSSERSFSIMNCSHVTGHLLKGSLGKGKPSAW